MGYARTWTILYAAALVVAPAGAQERLEGPPPAGPPAASGDAPRPASQAGTVRLEVAGHREWTSSGLRVSPGDVLQVRAWGRIRVAAAGGELATPAGLELAGPSRPIPKAAACGLIAVIGDSPNYIFVGREAELKVAEEGVLFFGINQDDLAGNTGEFEVRVTAGEKRGLTVGVGRDLLARPPDLAPGQDAVGADGRVLVSARRDWTTTGVTLRRGDVVTIEADGSVILDLKGTSARPDGIVAADADKLIPDKPTGALIAVIGTDNNDFLYVGSKATITAARDGLLFLGVNEGDLSNNSGYFSARVQVSGAGAANDE
jgi:hypothetical protein